MSVQEIHPPPKVSVIMPVYNVARYVREAIESVMSQRFQSFELLVADDASEDRTGAIVDEYAGRPRVRIFHNLVNLGAGATRNHLLREASGAYITPCDGDDVMLPGNLQRLSTFLDEHPETGVVYADVLLLRIGHDEELLDPPIVSGADCAKTWDLLENVINHPGSMSRKDILLAAGGYDEDVYSVDDWSLWLKVAELTHIHYLPGEIYYLWRRIPASMTRSDEHRAENVRRIIAAASIRRGFAPPDWAHPKV